MFESGVLNFNELAIEVDEGKQANDAVLGD